MKVDPYRILVFLGTVWGLTFVLLMIDTNLSDPNKFVGSDYVTNFYVAGHLVASGQASKLYPSPDDFSLTGSPFDRAAHSLLSHLPEGITAIFRYCPLVALIFAPLSKLPANISLLFWQGISIAALILSSFFLSRVSQVKATDIAFLSALFFPVMINLWAGQVSLVLGLLPLSAGYFLLIKGRPFMTGLVWSFLALKPQYFPVAVLVAFAQAFVGRFECVAGLVVGVLGIAAANMALFPTVVNINWLSSLKLSDTMFLSGLYKIPVHLTTSLPVNLLTPLPTELRATVKLPVYVAAVLLWLAGLWQGKKIVNSNLDEFSKVSLTLVIGLLLLPLTSPHLLYYDLCIFLPTGVILLGNKWLPLQSASLKRIALIGWISISIYAVVFLNVTPSLTLPLVLSLILLILFAESLRRINKICAGSRPL